MDEKRDHSPTPWSWHNTSGVRCIIYSEAGNSGRNIAVTCVSGSIGEEKANADAIVRAVNLLPVLVDVLEAFPLPGLPGKSDWTHHVVEWWNSMGRLALQKTQGGK